METPSRRMASTSLKNKKQQEESLTKSRHVLVDITNDSPIVGLAKDRSTPASAAVKSCPRSAAGMTPGSGEALLRRQVNSLLERVEEGKSSSAAVGFPLRRPPLAVAGGVLGFFSSPSQLLAPTPANTPQIPNLSVVKEESKITEQQIKITPQVDEESQITRTLLFDSPGKSEESSSVSSAVTYQDTEKLTSAAAADDDSSSAWSIQANASSALEDDDHDKNDFLSHDDLLHDFEEEEEEEEEECVGDMDDLCDFLGKMTVNDDEKKFAGRHTRFVYNSDGEMEGEEEVACGGVSPGVVVLKGLPVPEGKHLRFPDDEDEEDA